VSDDHAYVDFVVLDPSVVAFLKSRGHSKARTNPGSTESRSQATVCVEDSRSTTAEAEHRTSEQSSTDTEMKGLTVNK
jgi:hypothetical protein